jgi:hypothetical protein
MYTEGSDKENVHLNILKNNMYYEPSFNLKLIFHVIKTWPIKWICVKKYGNICEASKLYI